MSAITQNWINKNDLILQFGEIDLPQDDDGLVNDEKIDESIDSAILQIEAYMRPVGIEMPFVDSVKAELKDSVLAITRYRYSNNVQTDVEEVYKRYQEALAFLNKIASGKIVLSATSKNAGLKQMNIFRC